ncbi:hypothetical protein [Flavobacterium sp.]|uniref:hypothetical protein n=1 Tax=Flavobacterium sp. TaxID=239 RepID=UPI0037509013
MKNGLSNPALLALSTPQGQQALANVSKVQSKAIDLGFSILKIGLLCLGGYLVYRKITNAFKKRGQNNQYQPANISVGLAKIRAENLYKAMFGVANDFNAIMQNLSGLNYNGYNRVFNEFGERRGADFKKQNLTEWLYDQCSATQLAQLKFMTNNAIT